MDSNQNVEQTAVPNEGISSPPQPDEAELARFAPYFFEGTEPAPHEVRAFGVRHNNNRLANWSGIFITLATFVAYVYRLSKAGAKAVYVTLNPVTLPPGSQADALVEHGGKVRDDDVLRRRFILIDVDPTRPANTSATDTEKAHAHSVITTIKEALQKAGFPTPIFADSGNGYHLLYACDLPNDEEIRNLIRTFLYILAQIFSTPEAKVDTTVSNASRISKIYGTVSRKGEHTAERPHRVSRMIEAPERPLGMLSANMLLAFTEKYGTLKTPSRTETAKGSRTYTPALPSSEPPMSDNEILPLLKRIPTRPDYMPWLQLASAVLEAVGGDVSRASRLLNTWSPEEEPSQYELKLRFPLSTFTRDYLTKEAKKYDTSKTKNAVTAGPPVPDFIYSKLPSFFQRLLAYFGIGHERDVVLLSMLTVTSAHLRRVWTHYYDGDIAPFIYIVVLAHAGQGKGIASWGRRLGEHADNRMRIPPPSINDIFTGKRTEDDRPAPSLFLAGDTSGITLKQGLEVNGGYGLVFETEIDSMAGAERQDWGGFNDMLRKAYHHEEISTTRKGFSVRVQKPRLSMFLSGTPEQLLTLIKSVSNGLFSRFGLFTFTAPRRFTSRRPSSTHAEREQAFVKASAWLDTSVLQALESRSADLIVNLTDAQWHEHEAIFSEAFDDLAHDAPDEMQGAFNRSALLAVRLAVILSVIRYAEQGGDLSSCGDLACDDASANAGFRLALLLNEHSNAILKGVTTAKSALSIRERKSVVAHLPQRFTTRQAVDLGLSMGMSATDVERELTSAVRNHTLLRPLKGNYVKVTQD